MMPSSKVYDDLPLKIVSGIKMFPISGDGMKETEFYCQSFEF